DQETLRRAVLAQAPQEVRPVRLVAKRLVAQRDRVVVEPRLRVTRGRRLVVVHRLRQPAQAKVQVADPVVDAELDLALTLIARTNYLEIRLNGLFPALLLLVEPGLVLELRDRLH